MEIIPNFIEDIQIQEEIKESRHNAVNISRLQKDVEKILEQKETLDIKFSINELTWASGDSRYEISYDITSKNNFQSLTEDYYLDKNGDVSRSKMARGNQEGGNAEVVASAGVTREKGFLYYIDKDGDVSRSPMARRK